MLFIVLLVAAFAVGQFQSAAISKGKGDVLGSVARRVVQPISLSARWAAYMTGDFLAGLVQARSLKSQNMRMRERLEALSMYQSQIDDLSRQLDMLRAMQGFKEIAGKRRIPGTVIGYFPDENLMTLNVGSADGVASGCPVVTATGLLGTIQSTDTRTSQVLLITDVKRKIGAVDITRKPPPAGLLQGENSATLDLTFQDPQAPVEVGDVIVTSGFSDKIPRGIFIGRVIRVEDNQELGARKAKVFPTVAIGETREVQVLR